MEETFVWMTTRRIKPGTLADLERIAIPALRPTTVGYPAIDVGYW